MENHYRETLVELGKSSGMLGIIFRKAQNRIQDSPKLKCLIALIDKETWMSLDIDIKSEICESLLQKNAEDTKSGTGQCFTPRPLIKALVEALRSRTRDDNLRSSLRSGRFPLVARQICDQTTFKHFTIRK